MNAMKQVLATAVLAWGVSSGVLAADMDSAVTYSMGEFDRVGMSQPIPKTQSGKSQKKSATSAIQSGQHRQMNAQKAEFVRRMFWVALSMR